MTGKAATDAYKRRLVEQGKCTHCGKPCAPYRECQERREYKNFLRRQKSKFHRTASDGMKQPRGETRPWTDEQDAMVRKMVAGGTSFSSVVEALHRTPFAVVARARRLNLAKFNELSTLLFALNVVDRRT